MSPHDKERNKGKGKRSLTWRGKKMDEELKLQSTYDVCNGLR